MPGRKIFLAQTPGEREPSQRDCRRTAQDRIARMKRAGGDHLVRALSSLVGRILSEAPAPALPIRRPAPIRC
jgi:hypothetical protein